MMKHNTHPHASLHQLIQNWYHKHGRKTLPWRLTDDPYAIYLSEIMLQQTQVSTVLQRFYHPFLERFPSLGSLAQAPIEDVLKQWEGLGYYTRARNLHKTAQAIHLTGLPNTIEQLEALAGIGKNTAHAVACFGFKQSVPIMEANVKRILCRVFALSSPNNQQLWDYAHQLLDPHNSFDYNQALMDIGSTICTHTKPACGLCPFNDICQGKTDPLSFPLKKTKKATPIRHKTILVHSNHHGQYWTAPRETQFLGGLHGFDEYDHGTVDTTPHLYLGDVKQLYSHFTLQAEIYLSSTKTLPNHGQWNDLIALAKLPLSGADIKILSLLKKHDESL